MDIRRASVFFFHGENCEFEKITGYRHKQNVDVGNIHGVVKDIFDTGLNVMLCHSGEEGEEVIIMVDNHRFRQR